MFIYNLSKQNKMPKYNYTYLEQKEFASLARVSQPAVSNSLRRGTLVWAKTEDGKRDGINPDDPKNAAYIARIKNFNTGNRREVIAAQDARKRLSGGVPGNAQSPPSVTSYDESLAAEKAESAAIKQLQKAKAQVDLATTMKQLIPLDYVMIFWKRVAGAFENVLSLGDIMGGDVAAICGVTDPEIVKKVREHITDEHNRILLEVRKEGEKVPVDLGLSSW